MFIPLPLTRRASGTNRRPLHRIALERELIGVPIADGICELFPNERAESQRVGKAIRARGTWNPKNNAFSLIEAETVKPLLEKLPRTWSLGVGKVTCALSRNNTALSLHKSTNYYFLTTYSVSTKPIVENLLARFPIERKGTSERIVREHYCRYEHNIRSSLNEQIRAFVKAWELMRQKLINSLLPAEERIFNALATEHQREGFFIVRAFSRAAEYKGQ